MTKQEIKDILIRVFFTGFVLGGIAGYVLIKVFRF